MFVSEDDIGNRKKNGGRKGGNIQKTKNIVVNQGKKKKASLRNKKQASRSDHKNLSQELQGPHFL